MPKGLKPVRKRLATGEVRVYWYHRASGKRLTHDPETAEGLLEVAALDRRSGVAEAAAALPGGSYANLWAEYRKSPEWRSLRPRTRSDYQAVYDWIGAQAAAKIMVRQLTTGELYKLRDKAFRAKGRRFANYVVQVLRLTLEWGRKRDFLRENPARDVDLIRRPTGAVQVNRAWREHEVAAFVKAAPFRLIVPFALGLFAGMRQGDAVRVTWGAYRSGRLEWQARKNDHGCSVAVQGAFKVVMDAAFTRRGDALQIAVNSEGLPWTQSGFRASFFKLLRQLRAEGKVDPGCTFQGLRHTIGSAGREDGYSEAQVAAAIGDKSPAMAQTYGRDAKHDAAQQQMGEDYQKRFGNIDWKPAPADGKPLPGPKRPK